MLFYAEKMFFARTTIAYLLRNESLAGAVWGVDDETGLTWEHVMALHDVRYMTVPSERLLAPLGLDPVVRSLTLLDDLASQRVLVALGNDGHRPGAAPATGPGLGEPPAPAGTGDTTEARNLLRSLVGLPLATVVQARPNQILSVDPAHALVATDRAPQGEPVPITEVQAALDLLRRHGRVRIAPADLGHRSSFIGAVSPPSRAQPS